MSLDRSANLLDLTQQELGYNIPLETVREYKTLIADYSHLYSIPLGKLELKLIWSYRAMLRDIRHWDAMNIQHEIREFFSDYLVF